MPSVARPPAMRAAPQVKLLDENGEGQDRRHRALSCNHLQVGSLITVKDGQQINVATSRRTASREVGETATSPTCRAADSVSACAGDSPACSPEVLLGAVSFGKGDRQAASGDHRSGRDLARFLIPKGQAPAGARRPGG